MAVAELERIRPEFVDRADEPLISQLLDGILKDRIVNNQQKNSIMQANATTANKARGLIDTVKMKGEKASRMLIDHIERIDPLLHSELGLSCGQPAPPAEVQPKKEEGWSSVLVSTTEDAWWNIKKKGKVYPVSKDSLKNRVALLITNITFKYGSNRDGADADEVNMENLLTSLKYEVVKHKNLTAKGIDDALISFSKHPKLEHTDSVVVVIMSHGKRDIICGVNYKQNVSCGEQPDEFPIDNIYNHLGSEECQALLDKPKIIIIQACSGDEEGAVHVGDGPAVGRYDADKPGPSPFAAEKNIDGDRWVHKEKDFTCLISSTPDTVAYRHIKLGSILIQFVVKVFNTYAHKEDIDKLFKRVLRCFLDAPLEHKRQMATITRYTLTYDFYFYPGI